MAPTMEIFLLESRNLLFQLISSTGSARTGVSEFIKLHVKHKLSDFPPGLEWLNVSEPLKFHKHLKGKLVLLDFFTYCCINCMHIIPDLKKLEEDFPVEAGFTVIGVHSAKFSNEKISSNLLSAIQRYNISHPVVNDCNMDIWTAYYTHCWPTLLLISPDFRPLLMLQGEGHKETLSMIIKEFLSYFRSRNEITTHGLPMCQGEITCDNTLRFPGKICSSNDGQLLAISDSGHNRIIVCKENGGIESIFGDGRPGWRDGYANLAQFNAPQGVIFYNNTTLYVADTENHLIREINLPEQTVSTVVGTGVQGHDREGGKQGTLQAISSPWDLSIYHQIPQSDCIDAKAKSVVLIAMAGTHQIWAYFLEDTTWWKDELYTAGTCVRIAGSGREENRNNMYPKNAAFAQPSGLAISTKTHELYVADSESSSIRRLSLRDGKVSAVVGGSKDPKNLFAFGDQDGQLFDAKLQHVLGVAADKNDASILYIADTYNHKIKYVDLNTLIVSTLKAECSNFSEPSGLCVFNGKLFVTDTNNHRIMFINLPLDRIGKWMHFNLNKKIQPAINSDYLDRECTNSAVLLCATTANLKIHVTSFVEHGKTSFNDNPPTFCVSIPSNVNWTCIPNQNEVHQFDVDSGFSVTINTLEETPNTQVNLCISFAAIFCVEDKCIPKKLIVKQAVNFARDAQKTAILFWKLVINNNELRIIQNAE